MKKRNTNVPKSSEAMLRDVLIWDVCFIAYVIYAILGKIMDVKIIGGVLVTLYTINELWKIQDWINKK